MLQTLIISDSEPHICAPMNTEFFNLFSKETFETEGFPPCFAVHQNNHDHINK